MSEFALAPSSAEEVIAQIKEDIAAYINGGPDKEADHIYLAERYELDANGIQHRWEEARQVRRRSEAAAKAQLVVKPAIEGGVVHRRLGSFFKKPEAQPSVEPPKDEAPKAKEPKPS